MPNIPDIKPEIDINDNQVVDLLLASIAFEELGLAHAINAEAEKVQFILGTLDGEKPEKAPTIDDLLQINESVDVILKDVIKEEMLVEFKLEDIIKLTETTSSTTTSTSSSTTTSTNTTTSSTSTSTSTHTTTSTQSTTTTTTKNDKDIEGLSVSYSFPTYTGNGGNRVGSTTVTLTFALSDDSTVTETEIFYDIKVTTSKDFNYTIGSYDVAVKVTVTIEGMNNNMNITGATAEITSKVVNY